MPIPLPNLDDRTYDDLIEEARALIPSLYPRWTDHNPTDPGIILIELFAWLTEMTIYHLNRVPEANYVAFLRLLNGPDAGQRLTGNLDDDIRTTVLSLRERARAVTCDDFEYLARWKVGHKPQLPQEIKDAGGGIVLRARCVPKRNLDTTLPNTHEIEAPGHISLVVVTDQPPERPGLPESIRNELFAYLDERRLLTTRHHVVGPTYVRVRLTATLFLKEDVPNTAALDAAATAVRNFSAPSHRQKMRGRGPLGEMYTSPKFMNCSIW